MTAPCEGPASTTLDISMGCTCSSKAGLTPKASCLKTMKQIKSKQ